MVEEGTHKLICFYVLPLDLCAHWLKENKEGVTVLLTRPLGAQSELRGLELWDNKLHGSPFKEFLTIRFVYCPPGIS